MRIFAKFIEELSERGLTPQRVLEEIDAYHQSRRDCGPGMLVDRLRSCDVSAEADSPVTYWQDDRGKAPHDKLAGLKQEQQRREACR